MAILNSGAEEGAVAVVQSMTYDSPDPVME